MNVKWNLSISASDNVGGRDYMEDYYCVHIEEKFNKNIFALFGVFDGHGGHQAADYVKHNIVNELKSTEQFWSEDDDDIKCALKLVFRKLQNLLWIERESWPNTVSGYKSTAGTTASIAVIKNDKIYTGHVGDSGILLLINRNNKYTSRFLTKDHKPDNIEERRRVVRSGGLVMRRAGAERVVWSRLKRHKKCGSVEGNNVGEDAGKIKNHDYNKPDDHDLDQNETYQNQQQQRREYIPFLAVTRSLGDLWSYDPSSGRYHVSPDPDIECIDLCSEWNLESSQSIHYEMVLASDGLWAVMDEYKIEDMLSQKADVNGVVNNPASLLVENGLDSWQSRGFMADNICVIHVKFEASNLSDSCILQDPMHINSTESKSDIDYPFSCILDSTLSSDSSTTLFTEYVDSVKSSSPNTSTLKFNLLKDLVINYIQNPRNNFDSDIKSVTELPNCVWTRFFNSISSVKPFCQHRSDYDLFNLSTDDLSLPSIPELASKLEIHFPHHQNLYQTLISLPWTLHFISIMKDNLTQENNDFLLLFPNIDFFLTLPLFSSFWVKFYNKFLSQLNPHNHSTVDTNCSIILRQILQSQSHQVNALINPYLPSSMRSAFQLKRAKSTANHVLETNSNQLSQLPIIMKSKIRKCSSQNHLCIKTSLDNDETNDDNVNYPSGHTTPLLLSPQNHITSTTTISTTTTSSSSSSGGGGNSHLSSTSTS